MPTKNPRINIVLDEVLYFSVRKLAEKENVSMSTKARELIREALEIQEDIALAELAETREKSWDDSKNLSHDDVWS